MSLFSLFSFLHKLFPAKPVFAHCDIPCGIYTVEPAKTAAMTVIKMVEKIQKADPADVHGISRYTVIKEQHAQICKEELLILWTDYFKQEHLEMFPGLHEAFWKAAKLCSKVKRGVSMEAATELRVAVEEIADMFEKTHSAPH
jgi:nickel superoxide dismutase